MAKKGIISTFVGGGAGSAVRKVIMGGIKIGAGFAADRALREYVSTDTMADYAARGLLALGGVHVPLVLMLADKFLPDISPRQIDDPTIQVAPDIKESAKTPAIVNL